MPRLRAVLAVGLVGVMVPATPGSSEEGGCSKRHERRVVKRFIRAYNEGDIPLLDSLVATEPEFQQYRVWGEREFIFADDRSNLLDYFADRHNKGDSFELTHLRIEEYENSNPGFGIGFELYRETDDPRPLAEGTYGGKGSVDCVIYHWNIAPI